MVRHPAFALSGDGRQRVKRLFWAPRNAGVVDVPASSR